MARRSFEGAIDVIARAPDGWVYVIGYKTGTTGDEHYALQLALYVRRAGAIHSYEEISGGDPTPRAGTGTVVAHERYERRSPTKDRRVSGVGDDVS